MQTFIRTCLQDYNLGEDKHGNSVGLKFGETYHTSGIINGEVMVFTRYCWAVIPSEVFDEGIEFVSI